MARTARLPRGVIAACVLAAALALTGCAAGQVSQTADQVSAIDGANGTIGPIGVRDALLAVTDPNGYAQGGSAPLQMLVSNDSIKNETLTKITTPAAGSVEISGTATLPSEGLTTFAGDSKVTLTLKGLTAPITYGQSVPITFEFASAGSITLNVPIAISGERAGAHQTIDIQPADPTPLWLTGQSTPAN